MRKFHKLSNDSLAGCLLLIAVMIVSIWPAEGIARGEQQRQSKRMFVASEKLYLLNLPSARGIALQGVVLWKNDEVEVVEEKGLWARISPVGSNVAGWVRIFTLMELSDPDHKRRETEHRRTTKGTIGDMLLGEKDTSEYSSAAAARGISAFGRVMRENGAVSKADTDLADKVTEYSISTYPSGSMRKIDMKQQIEAFLKDGGLGIYMEGN
jgi:hypothetical protein